MTAETNCPPIFSGSPFLRALSSRNPELSAHALRSPDSCWENLWKEITDWRACSPDNAEQLACDLRRFRNRVALVVATADLCNAWPVKTVCRNLSLFADLALSAALDMALESLLGLGQMRDKNQGIAVLGMGKLGGFELNYSSDVDLVIFYDPECLKPERPERLSTDIVRAVRFFLRLIDESSAEGYVFRTDLRLRPNPSATALAVSIDAALAYYESQGLSWERSAFIKARPVAGDIRLGQDFLKMLAPFTWRRHLDYNAIEDIRLMRARMGKINGLTPDPHTLSPEKPDEILGRDLKKHPGGIRDIEFFIQSLQLVWGGRQPELRAAASCDALKRLADFGRLPAATAEKLAASYEFLRRLEHRIQMQNDEQSHSLPRSLEGLEEFARFAGYANARELAQNLIAHLQSVAAICRERASKKPAASNADTVEKHLSRFADAEQVRAIIKAWHSRQYRALYSERAHRLICEITPVIIEKLAGVSDPDAGLERFDNFLRALPALVDLLALFKRHHGLISRLADILCRSSWLASELARQPMRIEILLEKRPEIDESRISQFSETQNFQDFLYMLQRQMGDHAFYTALQILDPRIELLNETRDFSLSAVRVLKNLSEKIHAELAKKHGIVPEANYAIIGFGKIGAETLLPDSDLDIVCFYDVPEGNTTLSDGAHPLAAAVWYQRFVQHLVTALEAYTPEGKLFRIDLRLRPNGKDGALAAQRSGFLPYYRNQAWVWEHLALTRARVLCETAPLGIEQDIREVLCEPRDAPYVSNQLNRLRKRTTRFHARHASPLAPEAVRANETSPLYKEIKYREGGLMDTEFLTSALILLNANAHPECLSSRPGVALSCMAEASIIDSASARELSECWTGWLRFQALAQLGAHADTAATRRDMNDIADTMRRLYKCLLPAPQ